MRRKFIVALAGAAVLAVMPATGLAHGHHAKHHAKRHHVRTHIRHFRAASSGSAGTTGTPSTPGTPSSDSAGTVTSFDGTTLVITPTTGPPVSGVVTKDTELSCESAPTTTMQSDMSADGGGSQGGTGDQGASQSGSDDQGDQGDEGSQTTCTTANLTPGTVVHEADLRVSSAGAVWAKVDLITP